MYGVTHLFAYDNAAYDKDDGDCELGYNQDLPREVAARIAFCELPL
jgi:hypothetical protein